MSRRTDKQEQIKTFQKTKRGEGATLTVAVWSSVMVHTQGRNEEHRRGCNSNKQSLMTSNKAGQGRAGQGKTDTDRNTGE